MGCPDCGKWPKYSNVISGNAVLETIVECLCGYHDKIVYDPPLEIARKTKDGLLVLAERLEAV